MPSFVTKNASRNMEEKKALFFSVFSLGKKQMTH
jgi:hypothetical protein